MFAKKALLYFSVCALTVPAALADGFYGNGVSARTLALGGIYTPSSDSALDAMSSNPAGLALLSARTLDLSLASMFARGSFSNSVNKDAKLSAAGVIPYGAFGTPLGSSRFRIGVGLIPELVSASDWQYTDAPGAAGASYGKVRHKSAILAARSTAGVGVSLTRALSIGASVGVVYNSNTLEAPYIFQSHPALKGLKTMLDLKTNGTGWNTSVGVIARLSRRVGFNAAWKSKTVIESTGEATGNLAAQFAAVGMAAQPDFRYAAKVRNVLPQSVIAGLTWQANSRWKMALQTDWVNWKNAFSALPVALTEGSNSDINGMLKSNSLSDTVPLDWKDKVAARLGVERVIGEETSLRAGFAHGNNPVPSSTLSPLTAAIVKDTLSAGISRRVNRWRFDAAYSLDLGSRSRVGKSSLQSGEYSNSTVKIGTQSVVLSSSVQF